MTEVRPTDDSRAVDEQHTDLEWQTVDGVQIVARSWTVPRPRAQVLIVHGLGDHGGRFDHVVRSLVANGYSVMAPDLRGHGRSGGQRGYVPRFESFFSDLDQCLTMHCRSDLPVILYGQSLGGLISLGHVMRNVVRREGPRIRGVIASSPALAISLRPPTWKLLIGRSLASLFPRMSLVSGVNTRDLTDDDLKLPQIAADPLRHTRVTARTYFGMVKVGEWCRRHVDRLMLPSLILHSPGDPITDFQASEQFAQQCGSQCTFRSIVGGKHELHNLKNHEPVLDEIIDWLS